MRRRSMMTFVILNVLISLGVAFAVISFFTPQNTGGSVSSVITVPVLITATTDPNATPRVIILTATPLPGQPAAVAGLPTGLFDATAVDGTSIAIPTLDPTLIGASVALQGTATALPQNCILHTVKDGDTPFGIAGQYGADGFALMEVNGLNDELAAALQIGDTLIVPLEGCTLSAPEVVQPEVTEAAVAALAADATDTAETNAEATEAVAAVPTVRPTLTLPPTATNADLSIVQVFGAGDITTEGVEIENTGNTVNINGWTLTDADGNTYTFAEQMLFSGARLTVNTRTGRNTTIVLFWGRDDAVWEAGDVVTLRDDEGTVQSSFRVPRPVNLN